MARQILVLMAHPTINQSTVNREMFERAKRLDCVTAVDLYANYPDHHIDIDFEQRRLLEHDVVIFQFPFYWYSTPAILKEWQDVVLENGFAYGPDGNALRDKIFLAALSAGGGEDSYCASGRNNFSIRSLLTPLEQMAHLTQMQYLPPFVLFESRRNTEAHQLSQHIARWESLLTSLSHSDINWSMAESAPRSEQLLDQLFVEH